MAARILTLVVVYGGLALALAGWWLSAPRILSEAQIETEAAGHVADLGNGARMFHAGGCASCHAAPGATGDERLVMAGGVELVSHFGTFRAPNISPGPLGLGGWNDADFVNAMWQGVSPDGRHYYPAFPYTSYQRMRLADLLDLKAFLDTLPVSDAVAQPHGLGFPFSVRRGVGLW